ncbi:hypothetical protein GWK47_017675 [Chionoecetes opilio]|uniref:Uncharacterized protein n=1 Tax=Chionoecetes opilio TaxID=41210 RepID=A0A8J4XRD8_CHIOP|nr:hypothetical protein GWK47_017675 [Chionoecetes opilio]
MQARWLCGAMVVVLIGALVHIPSSTAYVTSFPDEPDIDGIMMTVGIAVAKFLSGLVPYPTVSALLLAIINAWEPKPEDNYWEHVKDNVEQVCGEFINEHNMQQVQVYKKDLMSLLMKYERAEVTGDGTYPDKNTAADAITTSIITNRFLVEAALMPWSMAIDFTDIASVHILILKDAADSYTVTNGDVSRWWVDLSNELKHYIEYGIWLEKETMKWRNNKIDCFFDKADGACLAFEWIGLTCYDKYEITDPVRRYKEGCLQLHPDNGAEGSCSAFCDLYQSQVNRDDARWSHDYLGAVVEEWEALKIYADNMAQHVSKWVLSPFEFFVFCSLTFFYDLFLFLGIPFSHICLL